MPRIPLTPYYSDPGWYPFIPEPLFASLEAAFLAGEEYAEASEADLNKMLSDHAKATQEIR